MRDHSAKASVVGVISADSRSRTGVVDARDKNERPGGGQPTGACSEWNNDPASGNFAPLAPIPLNASSLKSQFLTSFNLRRFRFGDG